MPEQLRGAPQQRHVADGLRRREQQQLARVARERLQLPHEALLDAADQRHRARQPEAAGHRRRRQPARQLQQRERIARRLGEDPVTHALVERPGNRGVQQRARVARAEALDRAAPAALPTP